MPVAAGADDIDRPGRRRDRQHSLPHGDNRAGDLRHGLAARAERHQKTAELGRSDASRENKLERRLRFGLGQARPGSRLWQLAA